DSRREWDERHSMDNVRSILTTGALQPSYALYPSLAYLPHTAVLAAVRGAQRLAGAEPLPVVEAGGSATPAVYRICRLIGVLFAAATVVLTYVAGRRIFGPGVGLLAATLLAFSAWFVRGAHVFKPDPLLMLLTMATFLWSLDAAERGALRSYLLAGVGVGLTAAAKQNGALAAIAVIGATLFRPLELRRWLWLALAGVASAVVFVALNPFPDLILEYTQIGTKYNTWVRSQAETTPMPHVLLFLPRLFLTETWHGPVVGAAALLGIALLPLELLRRRRLGDGRGAAAGIFLTLVFVVGFPLACAAISSYPKTNIYLPLLPFTSLTAAWVLAAAGSWLARRLSPSARRWALPIAVAALLALIAPTFVAYVYQRSVPTTTLDRAARTIQHGAPGLGQRIVVYEEVGEPLVVEHRWTAVRGVAAWAVGQPSLARVPAEALDRTDFEVFPRERLLGPEGGFYLGRLQRLEVGDAIWEVEPRRFRVRGPRLLVLAHPWRAVEPGLPLEWHGSRKGSKTARAGLPDGLAADDLVTLDLELSPRQGSECRLLLGGREIEIEAYAWEDGVVRWMSRRFPLGGPRAPLRLECPEAADFEPAPAGQVWRWVRD
ncbi:MAG: glycosyltransferase family 39 protein, partial [Thermoanaerobaculia bacterium]|nr:glycosyltransferase family 39 protein [Thermoanaerobaculia bacterium]